MSKTLTLIFLLCITASLVYAGESCASYNVGTVQNRYIADECSYRTQVRSCCKNKQWSSWFQAPRTSLFCYGPQNCSPEQCYNEILDENGDVDKEECQNREATTKNCAGYISGAISGQITRTATCNSGYGWVYGQWQPVGSGCECDEDNGYESDGTGISCNQSEWHCTRQQKAFSYNDYCEDTGLSNTRVYLRWAKEQGSPNFATGTDIPGNICWGYGNMFEQFLILEDDGCYGYFCTCEP